MKWFYGIKILLILGLYSSLAAADSDLIQNKEIKPNDNISVPYQFQRWQIITCTDSNLVPLSDIKWAYKGKDRHSKLPVSFKQKNSFSGEWADDSGSFIITNNDPQLMLKVTCKIVDED